jgi:putative addiction module killer protein
MHKKEIDKALKLKQEYFDKKNPIKLVEILLETTKRFRNFLSKWIQLLMYFIEKTVEFDNWLRKLKDIRAKAKILFRILKIENNEHFGDCEPVGDEIRELRINYAKGYRVYFKEKDGKIILLLIGGDKSTQQRDIEKAKEIWRKIKK